MLGWNESGNFAVRQQVTIDRPGRCGNRRPARHQGRYSASDIPARETLSLAGYSTRAVDYPCRAVVDPGAPFRSGRSVTSDLVRDVAVPASRIESGRRAGCRRVLRLLSGSRLGLFGREHGDAPGLQAPLIPPLNVRACDCHGSQKAPPHFGPCRRAGRCDRRKQRCRRYGDGNRRFSLMSRCRSIGSRSQVLCIDGRDRCTRLSSGQGQHGTLILLAFSQGDRSCIPAARAHPFHHA